MTSTPVGMRCPECSRQRTRVVRAGQIATTPRVTFALIAINVLVFLTEQGQFTLSGSPYGSVVEKGWLYRPDISIGHRYYELVTSAFIHADILHIGFNMYLLYLLGMMLEPAIGSLRFGTIYFTSMLCGACGALIATSAPSIGASGAIFGLMGAAAVELRARGFGVMQSGIGMLIILNLVLSVALPGISIGDHIGGLIGGALAGWAFRAADGRRTPALGFAACVALSALAVVGALLAAQSTAPGFA